LGVVQERTTLLRKKGDEKCSSDDVRMISRIGDEKSFSTIWLGEGVREVV
jgi:hypothetical protein